MPDDKRAQESPALPVTLNVNGKSHALELGPRSTLLVELRDSCQSFGALFAEVIVDPDWYMTLDKLMATPVSSEAL